MSISHNVWIPCTVDKGMFSSEVAVDITVENETVSFFADKSLIREIHGQPHILVTLVGDNHRPKS